MSNSQSQTIAEKILSSRSDQPVHAGEFVVAELDQIMFHDGTFNLVMKSWEKMGKPEVSQPERVTLVIDHSAPSPNQRASNLHQKLRAFASRYNIKLFDVGSGICHQLVPENGLAGPGDLIIGADSHTVTYGALNAFSTGVGATDLAAGLVDGHLWFKVPETIRVNLHGTLPPGVYSKDIILWLAGQLKADGATYKVLEFGGRGLKELSISARMTISNMAIELGGKAGIMEPDDKLSDWIDSHTDKTYTPVDPDQNASYEEVVDVQCNDLVPLVAKPHEVDNVTSVTKVAGKKIDQGVIGTCTNGRLEDLSIASQIGAGEKIAPRCRLIVAPASRSIYRKAIQKGIIDQLIAFGATVITPGCGPCLGTHNGIPADGETVISTANRNFKGRMGNENASIYLGSPATVMASVIAGKIADPRDFL